MVDLVVGSKQTHSLRSGLDYLGIQVKLSRVGNAEVRIFEDCICTYPESYK